VKIIICWFTHYLFRLLDIIVLEMADESRYFTLPNTLPDEVKDRGNEFYIPHLVELAEKCWDHHEKNVASPDIRKRLISSSGKQTLYTG
jgi:hypothetical protein